MFSKKWFSIAVIVFCIASKSIVIAYYSYIGNDKTQQLEASHNLLKGKGWTHSYYSTDDLSTEILEPFCFWPPGYGIMITPLISIFKTDLFSSTVIFEILFFLIFILICRELLKTQGTRKSHINLFTVLISFFPYEFTESSNGTDLPALCFLLAFFYAMIKVQLCQTKSLKLQWGILGGIALFLAGFTRYQYMPVVLLMCIIVIVIGYTYKKQQVFNACLACAFTGIICTGGLLLFQNWLCGSPFYISGVSAAASFMEPAQLGIHVANLRYMYPAVPASFANINVSATALQNMSGWEFKNWLLLFSAVNMICYCILTVAAIFYLNLLRKKETGLSFFNLIGLILSILILLELIILSVVISEYKLISGTSWTYIADGRYHGFIIVFIQLLFFRELSSSGFSFRLGSLKKIITSILIFIFFLSWSHQVYFTVKTAFNFKKMRSGIVHGSDVLYFHRLLDETMEKYPGKEIIIASPDRLFTGLASINNLKGALIIESLNEHPPVVKNETILITIIPTPVNGHFEKYIRSPGVKFIGELAGSTFYMQQLGADFKN